VSASVLIVDDNLDLLELLHFALTRKGITVETATCGEEGLEALRTRQPDLVLVDFEMPDMKGNQFLDRVEALGKQSFSESSFVYCSAGACPDDKRVKGCLNKMTGLNEFVGLIRNFLPRGSESHV